MKFLGILASCLSSFYVSPRDFCRLDAKKPNRFVPPRAKTTPPILEMSVLGSDPEVPVSELLFELPIQEMLYELTVTGSSSGTVAPLGLRIRQIEALEWFSDSAQSQPDPSRPARERARKVQQRTQAGHVERALRAIIKLS